MKTRLKKDAGRGLLAGAGAGSLLMTGLRAVSTALVFLLLILGIRERNGWLLVLAALFAGYSLAESYVVPAGKGKKRPRRQLERIYRFALMGAVGCLGLDLFAFLFVLLHREEAFSFSVPVLIILLLALAGKMALLIRYSFFWRKVEKCALGLRILEGSTLLVLILILLQAISSLAGGSGLLWGLALAVFAVLGCLAVYLAVFALRKWKVYRKPANRKAAEKK